MKKDLKLKNLSTFLDISGLDPESSLIRKNYVTEVKILPDEEKTAIFRCSTAETDLDGDVILPEGCDLTRYGQNSPVLWAHAHGELAIGATRELAIDGDEVVSKIKFADHSFATDVFNCVKGGFVKAISVGFVPLSTAIRGTKAFDKLVVEKGLKILSNTQRIITKWLLLEQSICNMGCNPDALVMAVSEKSLSLDGLTFEKLGIERKEEPKVEPVVEPVKVEEPKVDTIVEPIVKEEPKVEPIVEKPPEPKRTITILRNGGYVPDAEDKKMAKMIQKGKII